MGKTINCLFEEQVQRTPSQIALIYRDEKLTYKELFDKVNTLAAALIQQGLHRHDTVAILAERSLKRIIAVFAVLRAGGAYLPIDPEYPAERKKYMLEDSEASILLTVSDFVNDITFTGTTLCFDEIDDMSHSIPVQYESETNDIAYLNYTSGSTGLPKAVMVEHRNVIAYIRAFQHQFQISEASIMMQQASFSFDVFTEEVFGTLLNGGTLVIYAGDGIVDIEALRETLIEHNVNMLSGSPFLLNELNKLPTVETMRVFISGGDVLKREHISNLIRTSDVYNTYGPTETCVCAAYYKVNALSIETNIPIGKPILGYDIYILDQQNHLCPAGTPGEICIAGEGVARGYYKREQLTASKFVQDPFNSRRIMYKTGDLGCWREDGNLEFASRMDEQVKIRGYRIEPREIESVIAEHPSVQEVLVMAHQQAHGQKELVAYVVGNDSNGAAAFKNYLIDKLPLYMIPKYIIFVDRFSLTPNGKIDRKSLPLPTEREQKEEQYIEPATEMEKKLAELWQEVLGINRVGALDNFLHLGGHSLKAVSLVSRMRQTWGRDVRIDHIFRAPILKELAELIKEGVRKTYSAIPKAAVRASYPLTAAQRRIYVLEQFEHVGTTYHISWAVRIQGNLDIARCRQAFAALSKRHDALRTCFVQEGDDVVQQVAEEVSGFFVYERLTGQHVESTTAETLLRDFVQPFILAEAPLFRLKLVSWDEQTHMLLVDMHHMICDGITVDLLWKEFGQLYQGQRLQPPRLQYTDYTVWQAGEQEAVQQQKAYWLDVFQGELPVLNLPLDYSRPPVRSFEGAGTEGWIGSELTGKLKQLSAGTGTTMYMVLL
ncbi:amino acid adenylation domain-containing protein, partial [Paenibacillus sp.]|uniref:amino acid adenylation domain-containing protein n=1 Tax=Paenibacillus sp. TaxID=58172 RepID=UPI00282A8ED9